MNILKRKQRLIAALALAAVFALLGSTNVNAQSKKPGGGGGGTVLPGRISFQRSERVQYWFGWSRNYIGRYSMLGDGSDKRLEADRFGEPSYALHDNQRWTLNMEHVDGTSVLGWNREELFATNDNGLRIQLTNDPYAFVMWPVRWGKDDSFVSFISRTHVPAAPGEGNYIDDDENEWFIDNALMVADINWTSGKPEMRPLQRVLGANTAVPESGYYQEVPYSQIVYCDWSPAGDQVVCERRMDGYSAPSELELTTFFLDGSSTAALGRGRDPEWSPTSDQIAFAAPNSSLAPDLVLWTIRSDGSNRIPLTTSSQDAHYRPKWSPDGKYIAFLRQKQSNQKGSSDWIDSIFRVSASGGSITNLTSDVKDDDVWLEAWR